MAFKPGIRLAIPFEALFPHGCVIAGGVSAVTDFDIKKGDDHKRDKATGMRLWQIAVFDADPEARDGQREVKVKIASETQPVPPGGPLTQVEFSGMSVSPWVNDKGMRPKVEFSVYADEMRAVVTGRASKSAGQQQAA